MAYRTVYWSANMDRETAKIKETKEKRDEKEKGVEKAKQESRDKAISQARLETKDKVKVLKR